MAAYEPFNAALGCTHCSVLGAVATEEMYKQA